MKAEDYDLFVIGAGSGGVRAARTAAALGARVGIAEERWLGGTCVNVGCIPKKLYHYAAHYGRDFADSRAYGWRPEHESAFDWQTLKENKDREISRLNEIYNNLLENPGAKIHHQRARLTERPGEILLADGQTFSARHILLATGGWPWVPDIPGREHVISSNEFFALETRPDSVLVVGGGYIAVELAGIFAGLGVETTLVYRGDAVLRGFDRDLREALTGEMRGYLHLRLETRVDGIRKTGDGRLVTTLDNGEQCESDQVLYATGRRPNTADLGLEQAGVRVDGKGAVVVDEQYRSSLEPVYAVGDVIDRMALTPVALAEGEIVARQLFQDEKRGLSYEDVPSAVFSQPNLATVGLNEEQARERYSRIRVYRSRFRHLRHTLTGRDEKILLKLLVDDASDRVVGIHMLGEEAAEIIQGLAVAMRAGATKAGFDATLGIHPTAAEEFVTMRTPED